MNGVQEMKLGDICDSSQGRRNNFNIMEKDGAQPVKDEVCQLQFRRETLVEYIVGIHGHTVGQLYLCGMFEAVSTACYVEIRPTQKYVDLFVELWSSRTSS